MRKVITFLPAITTQSELEVILVRIGWYLYPYRFEIEKINLPMVFDPPSTLVMPAGYDELISQRLSEMFPLCEPVQTGENVIEETEHGLADQSDLILVWNWPEDESKKQQLDRLLERARWYDVDAQRSRAEGSYYLWMGPQFFADNTAAIEKSRENLRRFRQQVSKSRAYVFGTGPSLSTVTHRDYSDGDVYVANSIVKNRDLLKKIKPKALVAADPVFHSGCSAYAAEFRDRLIEVLDEFELFFFVPLRDYYIYDSILPGRHLERLICIPFDDASPYNIDLTNNFYVNGTGNVLTLFLLPLAATFHDEIAILGCDGRPRSEDNYFWSHDTQSQFGDLMESVKHAHPAFFNISYNDYYDEHIETLDKALDVIEEAGKGVVSLTPSHIPVLSERFIEPPSDDAVFHLAEELNGNGKVSVEIVGLAPDATTELGHYLGYENHLHSAFSRAGIDYTTLCNRNIPTSILANRESFYPALTIHTWDIGNNWEEPPTERMHDFCEEVTSGLEMINSAHGFIPRTIYLYYGSLYHVEAIKKLLDKREYLTATVNLFWTCYDPISSAHYARRWRGLAAYITENARLNVTASTVELQRELSDRLDLKLPLAPHPSPTFSDEDYLSLRALSNPDHKGSCRVLFPGMLSRDKGFHLSVDAARVLASKGAFECVLRSVSDEDTPPELVEMVDSLAGKTRVLQGEMDHAGFINFLRMGDVAVIPYSVKGFARRTSGLLIDALYCGLPVVAIRGTWLGNRIEDSGAGIVVDDGNPEAIATAVETIHSDLDNFKYKAAHAGAEWYQSNSWAALAASILDVERAYE